MKTLSFILSLELFCLAVGGTPTFAATPSLEVGRQHWAFQPLRSVASARQQTSTSSPSP